MATETNIAAPTESAAGGAARRIDLTDLKLRALRPRDKTCKVTDRDGMYVAVSPTGALSFRYDYRIGGRPETLTVGRYDSDIGAKRARDPDDLDYGMSLSLAEARTLLARARRLVERGESPSRAKVEKRAEAAGAITFGGWADKYFEFKADPKSGGLPNRWAARTSVTDKGWLQSVRDGGRTTAQTERRPSSHLAASLPQRA